MKKEGWSRVGGRRRGSEEGRVKKENRNKGVGRQVELGVLFLSSRRRHTRFALVSWARSCV